MRPIVRSEEDPRSQAKRDRTRGQLLDAALRVFARKGVGEASIQEITVEAALANGTFYNYFRTKDEIVAAVSVRLAARFADQVVDAYAAIADPAERVAIAVRSFVAGALADPSWGWAMVRITDGPEVPLRHVRDQFLRTLRAGKRRRRFDVRREQAAIDLVFGASTFAMRAVLEGQAGPAHASATAAHVLRGLGVAAREADEIARRPLPGGAARGGS